MWQPKTICSCNGVTHRDFIDDGIPYTWFCACNKTEGLWRKFNDFAISEHAMDKCTFENYMQEREPDLYRAAREWASTVTNNGTDWLCMTGDNGTGKSHLMVAAIRELVKNKIQAVAISAATMYDRLEHANFAHGIDHGPIEARLIDCPVLAIDDIGARKLDERLAGTMFRIIDGRSMAKRPTLITADKPLGDIEGIPGWRRIVDRIFEHGLVVSAKGGSYRYDLAKQRTQTFKDNK